MGIVMKWRHVLIVKQTARIAAICCRDGLRLRWTPARAHGYSGTSHLPSTRSITAMHLTRIAPTKPRTSGFWAAPRSSSPVRLFTTLRP